MSTNDKILDLNSDKILKFNKELLDRLYDRKWCSENGINYVEPNVLEAKKVLF